MARPINRLTARQVQTLGPGYHADGGGLYLQVSPTATRSWIFRYTLRKRPREMGLGSVGLVTLQEARQRAQEARRLLADGIDPLEARAQARSGPEPRTWGEAVEDFITSQRVAWKNDAQAGQWEQSLADYGPRAETLVRDVDTNVVLERLRPVWKPKDKGGKPETASRVRGRIEKVWDAERVAGNVSGENPARWKGHLEALLAPPARIKRVKHHEAMPYADAPDFYMLLTHTDSVSRRAMRWTLLTVARTAETTGMEWSEIDIDAGLWTIPAGRIKGGREHVVPLTEAAIACLDSLPRDKPPFAMSENTMLFLLQREPPRGYGRPYTVHGFRSTFRDWAGETTDFPNHVVEMALAHAIRDKTEAAYRRGNLLAKRRELMDAWATYLTAPSVP